MPAADPPRRITITRVPFDFEHSRISVQQFTATGEFLLPGRVCDFIVANGYGHEGWASDSKTRTRKSGPRRRKATPTRKSATAKADAGADVESNPGMGRADVSAAHRAVTGQRLAPAAD